MVTQSYKWEPRPAAGLLLLARMKSGLSQRELAERAGVPATMISAYERGKREPTMATLLRLVRAAGFDVRMLLEPYIPAAEVAAPLDDEQRQRWQRAVPVATTRRR